ncbi:MAG: hypothetical protein EHM33_07955 [Chloroflexi bacterium]|nr:MAG: hypothetical protein EHM33_07955 [Chloroflexota bacterium]
MQKTATLSVYLIVSILILGTTIFAKEIGLDPNPGWGKGRIALLIFGFLIALFPWLRRKPSTVPDKTTHTDLFALPVLVAVIGIYFWFASVSHDSTSNYYSLLATSFRNGELSLPLTPDPALLALPNPYDPAARQGIKVPLDLSLYNGKFYLYWGPAPSLLLAIAQPFLPEKIGEVHLLFVFLCGIFLAQFLLLMSIWQRFFPEIPKWILILSIVLAGLANPALWLLSQPKIYEAAIAGAQFFFIGGLLSAVLAMDRQPTSGWGLILAGTLWALAVGTRSVLVFPVIFMTVMVVYRIFKIPGQSFIKHAGSFIPLGLPLFIGAVGFGWYNWARFGSVLETGFTYQLAGPYLQKHMNELFSPNYIFQNLYNYLFNPFILDQQFPFIHPARGLVETILPSQVLPFYLAQSITGLLFSAPFTIFAAPPVSTSLKQWFKKTQTNDPGKDTATTSLNWIVISLFGSFLLTFISLLTFFWSAMRYMEDFMPALVLLSIVGFWHGYQSLSQHPNKGKMYAILGIILSGVSIVAAISLALSVYFTNGLL